MGPGHPECPERLDAIDDRLLISGVSSLLDHRDAPLVPLADVELAHDRMYVAALRGMDGRIAGVASPTGLRPPFEMQERVMLGLLLANPGLFDLAHEDLGRCLFSNESLDNLRRGILKHLGGMRGLDMEGLSAHLRTDGFSLVLDTLLDASERRMRSVRSYEGIEEAKALWEDVFHHYTRKDLLADVSEAHARLAQDGSQAAWTRFEAVKRHEQAAESRNED